MAFPSVPNTFVNNTQIADGTEVNANFNALVQGLSNGTLDFDLGNVRVRSALSADGAANFYSSVSFAGTAVFSAAVVYHGAETHNGAISASGGMSQTSAATFTTNVTISGNVNLQGQKDVRYYDSDSTNYIAVRAAATVGTNYTVTLPQSAPANATKGYLKYDGTNYTWNLPTGPVNAVVSDYVITDADGYSLVLVTAGASNRLITLPSTSTNAGRIITVKKVDTGVGLVLVDSPSTELIDGESSAFTLADADDWVTISCDGTNYQILAKGIGTRVVSRSRYEVGNGHGSTSTKYRRFSTAVVNTGNAISTTETATDGRSWSTNVTGIFRITIGDNFSGGGSRVGISRNSSSGTTNIEAITNTQRLAHCQVAGSVNAGVSWTGRLTIGDIIRHHTDGGATATSTDVYFDIERIGA